MDKYDSYNTPPLRQTTLPGGSPPAVVFLDPDVFYPPSLSIEQLVISIIVSVNAHRSADENFSERQ